MDPPSIRVLHAYKVYAPDADGGVPAAIRALARGLMPQVDSRVLTTRRPFAPRQLQVEGVAVERVAAFGSALSLPLAPSYPWRLRRAARWADLLALHAPFPLADLGAVAGGVGRAALVVHWHADILGRRVAAALLTPLLRAVLRRAERIIVSHSSVVAHSPWLGPFAAKCRCVPYGIDPAFWGTLPEEEQAEVAALRQRHPRLVVALGRLVPYKGFDVLIEAFTAVQGRLVIIGEGPERDRLAARIGALGLGGRVELAGRLAAPAVRRLLHAARVFAFPSVSAAESFGIAQLEAMAAGLPVVNTALPTAVPWVARDGEEGLTVPPGDPGALAVAISALLEDPARAQALGAAGRARVAAVFTEARYREGVLAIWREALAARAAPSGGAAAAMA